jgi:hypothetical protein
MLPGDKSLDAGRSEGSSGRVIGTVVGLLVFVVVLAGVLGSGAGGEWVPVIVPMLAVPVSLGLVTVGTVLTLVGRSSTPALAAFGQGLRYAAAAVLGLLLMMVFLWV